MGWGEINIEKLARDHELKMRALKFQTSEEYLNFSPKLILSDTVFF